MNIQVPSYTDCLAQQKAKETASVNVHDFAKGDILCVQTNIEHYSFLVEDPKKGLVKYLLGSRIFSGYENTEITIVGCPVLDGIIIEVGWLGLGLPLIVKCPPLITVDDIQAEIDKVAVKNDEPLFDPQDLDEIMKAYQIISAGEQDQRMNEVARLFLRHKADSIAEVLESDFYRNILDETRSYMLLGREVHTDQIRSVSRNDTQLLPINSKFLN